MCLPFSFSDAYPGLDRGTIVGRNCVGLIYTPTEWKKKKPWKSGLVMQYDYIYYDAYIQVSLV